jgi:hypothetical protein
MPVKHHSGFFGNTIQTSAYIFWTDHLTSLENFGLPFNDFRKKLKIKTINKCSEDSICL